MLVTGHVVIGQFSFAFTALCFLMRDMILLRGLVIVSGMLGVTYNGEVSIERGGRDVARSRDGTLVAAISCMHGGVTTATVKAVRPTRHLTWPVDDLRRRGRRIDVTERPRAR